jgi:hypothetical protein
MQIRRTALTGRAESAHVCTSGCVILHIFMELWTVNDVLVS